MNVLQTITLSVLVGHDPPRASGTPSGTRLYPTSRAISTRGPARCRGSVIMVASFVATRRRRRTTEGLSCVWATRTSWRRPRCCTSTGFCGETGGLQRRAALTSVQISDLCGGHVLRLAVYQLVMHVYSGFLGEAACTVAYGLWTSRRVFNSSPAVARSRETAQLICLTLSEGVPKWQSIEPAKLYSKGSLAAYLPKGLVV